MMTLRTEHDFNDEYYFEEEVQPELDNLKASIALGWWKLKTAIFLCLYIILVIIKGVLYAETIVESLLIMVASFLYSVFGGLRLASKIALDWVKARDELRSINVR